MNLEHLGVRELDAAEQRHLDGGLPGTGCPACDGPQLPPILGGIDWTVLL